MAESPLQDSRVFALQNRFDIVHRLGLQPLAPKRIDAVKRACRLGALGARARELIVAKAHIKRNQALGVRLRDDAFEL